MILGVVTLAALLGSVRDRPCGARGWLSACSDGGARRGGVRSERDCHQSTIRAAGRRGWWVAAGGALGLTGRAPVRGSVTSEELTANCGAILRRVERGEAFDVMVAGEVVAVLVPVGAPLVVPANVRGGFGVLGRFERAESVLSALRDLS